MEDRRKGDRRRLYGKPFLAMLMGGLPEDRRKGERRARTEFPGEPRTAVTMETVHGDFTVGDDIEAAH